MRGFVRVVLFFVGTLEVGGWGNVPAEGPYIIAVNHMSKSDPPLLYLAWPPVGIRFFAGEKWEKHLIFGPLMRLAGAIYIRRGEVDRKALKEALAALSAGSVFGLSPEGTRSRVGALIQARDGAAYLATRAKVPVLPVGIINSDRLGPNFSHLRRTHFKVQIGRPFMMPELVRPPRSNELSAFTHLIMVRIAALLPQRYWGYYAESSALKALLEDRDPWPHCLEEEGVVLQK